MSHDSSPLPGEVHDVLWICRERRRKCKYFWTFCWNTCAF